MSMRILRTSTFLALVATTQVGCSDSTNADDNPESKPGVNQSALMTQDQCQSGANIIVGTEGDDVLVGTNGDDCILGLGGDDVITGGNGNDTLVGGVGNDTLSGGNGNDTILGEDGADTLSGNNGNDAIWGGAGDDVIVGGNGDDMIQGAEGNDVLLGNNGNDALSGEGGNDVLIAGNGNDVSNGGDGIDACSTEGLGCEQITNPRNCATDVDCASGQRCLPGAGVCVGCLGHTECNDQNPTTVDQCVPTNGCSNIPCAGGSGDCNGNEKDGCEVNLSNDVSHCGTCDTVCSAEPKSTPLCQAGACTASYGFFAVSDVHVATAPTALVPTALSQMALIDPNAIAAFSAGDHTDNDTATQWSSLMSFLNSINSMFDVTATDFSGKARWLAALGNHDVETPAWYSLWSSSMTGQAGLGHNVGSNPEPIGSPNGVGVYFTVNYENALFAMMDGQHLSSATTSFNDDQTRMLAKALQTTTARFRFVFFHQPVYPCLNSNGHKPLAAGLPWIDLAEKNAVDLIVSGHTHVYTRSCRMQHAVCTNDGTGIVQLEIGSLGSAGPRAPSITTNTVTGTDAAGSPRTDTYNCNAPGNIEHKETLPVNDFCHVKVVGCKATVDCYTVGALNTTPFDSFVIDHCQ
jgi:hypothetical protein